MGWSEMDARCRRHPDHRQSRGVCPFCLREKLAQLTATVAAASSSPPSSPATLYFSDTNSSSSSSRSGRRTVSMVFRGLKAAAELTKSRSMASSVAAPEDDVAAKTKKAKGLWRRLVGSVRRKKEKAAALRSGTAEDGRPPAPWAL